MATGGLNEIEDGESVLRNSLLKQVQANWEQSRTNAESSHAMHLLIQRMPSMGVIDVVPDRFESWHAAKSDAEASITIAEQIAQQAEQIAQASEGSKGWRDAVARGEGP